MKTTRCWAGNGYYPYFVDAKIYKKIQASKYFDNKMYFFYQCVS